MSDLDKWIEIAKECKYLPENDLMVSNFNTHSLYHQHNNRQVHVLVLVAMNYYLIVIDRNFATWYVIYYWKNLIFNLYLPR